ncbi:tetraspanin-19-like isoform X2 [Olea europaea var. sylvestris]|uniref:Tetraspanin-19 n=1 Tax=Olea europaea subsp. europaea TaxID=158383 RepID=A0A8S0U2F5_OLEEU|nr:tetraspanin-19-like isoform X2 [Olea europaea var. sylvestris]CAA3011510.1 tetraspanin-19 [Olea europaea subsp. europaea]
MSRVARICFQSLLKVVNSGIGIVGIALIVYALWMFMVWQRHLASDSAPNAPIPWFIYTIIGLGVSLCVITCSGHIAAETANGCCLYIYMVFIFMLLVLEAAVTADVFLNSNWEEDFPDDPTGKLDELKDFIKDNFDICRWIGLTVVGLQGLSMLLAMILKALGPNSITYYESDDDYIPDRVPLLKNYVPPRSYAVSDPLYQRKNDSWNIKINSKAGR